jgi:hypothetical protein
MICFSGCDLKPKVGSTTYNSETTAASLQGHACISASSMHTSTGRRGSSSTEEEHPEKYNTGQKYEQTSRMAVQISRYVDMLQDNEHRCPWLRACLGWGLLFNSRQRHADVPRLVETAADFRVLVF